MRSSLIFAYVFFSLFVFVALSVLVSQFSSTFSQLFSLFSQDGRIFDFFLYSFYLIGFLLSLFALILSSWNQKEDFKIKCVILLLCLLFIFLFVFNVFSQEEQTPLLELILYKREEQSLQDLLLRHLDEFLISGFFYGGFVFAPLLCWLFDKIPNPNHPLGYFLNLLRPSMNIVLYVLIGCALQSYFHKSSLICYVDLFAFLLALSLLVGVFFRQRRLFGFYELCNLFLLCVGIIIFALSSNLIGEGNFIARYSLFACAFVAWCSEWMFAFVEKRV